MEKYQQIEALIEEHIRNGEWQGRLPPERRLAHLLGISRNTLRTALQILQERKIISCRRGSGTFVQSVPRQSKQLDTYQYFQACLAGLLVLFPPVAAFCAQSVKPTGLLDLETKLSNVGRAMHTNSSTELAKAQRLFLYSVAEGTHNTQLAAAVAQVIPQDDSFLEVLGSSSRNIRESLFAELVGLLGGIRRMLPEEARMHAMRYAETLLRICPQEAPLLK
jgi:DNA-binding FadR family transcriptional regulator